MLRLAHRVLSQTRGLSPQVAPQWIQNSTNRYQFVRQVLRGSQTPVTIADNVAVYYADSPKQEWAVTGEDFACIAPPFERFFIEWNDPGYIIGPGGVRQESFGGQWGSLFLSLDRATLAEMQKDLPVEIGDKLLNEARWFLWVHHLLAFRGHAVLVPFWDLIFVKETGEPLNYLTISEMADEESTRTISVQSVHRLHVPCLTLGFLHCKNVHQLDVTSSDGPTPKWCRQRRVPELKYHALQIDPNLGSKPRSDARKTEGDRSGKALHICRGHFAHFRDDGVSQGLFGRNQFGTFWIPAHTRGSLEHGKVVSTYSVKAPCNT